jgi:putative spermidine/putrescine transport system ATP-binding protein
LPSWAVADIQTLALPEFLSSSTVEMIDTIALSGQMLDAGYYLLNTWNYTNMDSAVSFHDVCRYYGEVRAVDHVSFEVGDGEFFAMLGPSGSGKTTSLRLIDGFEKPTSGEIMIHGTRTEKIPPYERNVNTVFQDYALFPHMTVLRNVAYGLMVKGVNKKAYYQKANEMLDIVKLGNLGARHPSQLSGGQRQRVALARALINEPRVLLLDEPLGALDLKLRKQMQVELKALQRQVGITFIYVTHDQDEALSMSDRLAVFNEGKIEQIGSPGEIYEYPASEFVADFVGDANLINADLAYRLNGEKKPYSIRPERIHFHENTTDEGELCVAQGKVTDIHYHGASTRYTLTLDDGGNSLFLVQQNSSEMNGHMAGDIDIGMLKRIAWSKKDIRYFNT